MAKRPRSTPEGVYLFGRIQISRPHRRANADARRRSRSVARGQATLVAHRARRTRRP